MDVGNLGGIISSWKEGIKVIQGLHLGNPEEKPEIAFTMQGPLIDAIHPKVPGHREL